jgi:hypothetical protein
MTLVECRVIAQAAMRRFLIRPSVFNAWQFQVRYSTWWNELVLRKFVERVLRFLPAYHYSATLCECDDEPLGSCATDLELSLL